MTLDPRRSARAVHPWPARAEVWEMSGTGPRSGPAGATAPARRKARKPSERSERPASEGSEKSLSTEVWEMSGTGPRSGPAGATAPARPRRRAARRVSQASGASARRLREVKRV